MCVYSRIRVLDRSGLFFFFICVSDHLTLNVRPPSSPTRRSSGLRRDIVDQRAHPVTARKPELAPDEVGGLDAVGAFIDRRDARVAIMLRGAGFLDEGSEEHTSELQSLMRISYAVFCLKNKN